ncbi:unnamed protein product [Ilex paraguariensis]|uniref:Uncharacterized protein n=1 Tax=Ilex paraguariensis TaxID=185542 RepID=A0ABC8S469_9AQUA
MERKEPAKERLRNIKLLLHCEVVRKFGHCSFLLLKLVGSFKLCGAGSLEFENELSQKVE